MNLIIPPFALGIRRSAEESQQECEDLRAQLRAMEAGAKAGEAAEEEALRLRTVERSAERAESFFIGAFLQILFVTKASISLL